jgi:hypothetical protein
LKITSTNSFKNKTVAKVFVFSKCGSHILSNKNSYYNINTLKVKEFANAKYGSSVKVKWDRKCGCSCGCSPGYRLIMPSCLAKKAGFKEYFGSFDKTTNLTINEE